MTEIVPKHFTITTRERTSITNDRTSEKYPTYLHWPYRHELMTFSDFDRGFDHVLRKFWRVLRSHSWPIVPEQYVLIEDLFTRVTVRIRDNKPWKWRTWDNKVFHGSTLNPRIEKLIKDRLRYSNSALPMRIYPYFDVDIVLIVESVEHLDHRTVALEKYGDRVSRSKFEYRKYD